MLPCLRKRHGGVAGDGMAKANCSKCLVMEIKLFAQKHFVKQPLKQIPHYHGKCMTELGQTTATFRFLPAYNGNGSDKEIQ